MVVGMMMGWGSVTDQQEWRKGPWTPEEDKLLTEYVKLHGEGRWSSVARSAGLKRSGKSCRLRWVNYLRPGLRRGHLTPQEEGIIIELHALWGNKWSTIARYLPGRTDNEIKNYWRTHFKKKPKVSDRKAKRSSLSSKNGTKQDEEINNTAGSTDHLFNQSDDHVPPISSGPLQPPAMTYSAQYPNMEMINPAGLPAQRSGSQIYISEAAAAAPAAQEAWLTDTVPVDGLWGWLWNFDDDQTGGTTAAGGVNHGMKSQYADFVNQNGGLVRWGSCSFGFDMHQNGAYIS